LDYKKIIQLAKNNQVAVMGKKVLVTGAGGFIGSHLCERLVKAGYTVKAFLKYNSQNSWGWLDTSVYKEKIKIILGDVRNYDSVRFAMKDIDIVFHLAALIGIPYSYYSPDAYVDTNIKGTLNMLQAARDAGASKVIHVSTSEVYGTAQFVPITETHPINPQSPYAATKVGADSLTLSFYRSFNLPVVIVRPFNTYGPRQSTRAIIPTIITQLLSGKKRIKIGSLFPTRDLTYVLDTSEGLIRAAESPQAVGEVINIGSNFEISMQDLADLIVRLCGVKNKIEIDKRRCRPDKSEVARLWADTSKAKQLLDWSCKYSLESGLRHTIAWFRMNKDKYLAKADLYCV
jgi:dTDP-glucose 4,6-dehydratase